MSPTDARSRAAEELRQAIQTGRTDVTDCIDAIVAAVLEVTPLVNDLRVAERDRDLAEYRLTEVKAMSEIQGKPAVPKELVDSIRREANFFRMIEAGGGVRSMSKGTARLTARKLEHIAGLLALLRKDAAPQATVYCPRCSACGTKECCPGSQCDGGEGCLYPDTYNPRRQRLEYAGWLDRRNSRWTPFKGTDAKPDEFECEVDGEVLTLDEAHATYGPLRRLSAHPAPPGFDE